MIEDFGGTPTGSPGSPTNPFTGPEGIQDAIDAAVLAGTRGEKIHVAAGSYDHILFRPLQGPRGERQVFADNSWTLASGTPAIEPQTGTISTTGVTIDGGQTQRTLFSGFIVRNWGTQGSSAGGTGIRIAPTPNDATGTGSSPRVENCTVESNITNPICGNYGGGGMQIAWNCHPLVFNCTFTGNEIDGGSDTCHGYGAALWIYGSTIGLDQCESTDPPDPVISHCTFIDNIATNSDEASGGAIALTCARAKILNCKFKGNAATHAGGAFYGKLCDGTLIRDCQFGYQGPGDPAPVGNTATWGGAIYVEGVAGDAQLDRIRIIYNTFTANEAANEMDLGAGGAIYLANKDATISHNSFASNVAAENAGAITLGASQNEGSFQVLVTSNVIGPANQVLNGMPDLTCAVFAGTAVEPDDETTLQVVFVNNTVAGNSQVRGVTVSEALGTTLVFDCFNSILYENVPIGSLPDPSIRVLDSPTLTVDYSDTEGQTFPGCCNLSLDPEFVGPTDFHLVASSSPCIDTGSNAEWVAVRNLDSQIPDEDEDGNPRIQNGTIDMGCYESQ